MTDTDDTSISKIPLLDNFNGDSILYAFQDTIIEDLEPISLGNTGVEPFSTDNL